MSILPRHGRIARSAAHDAFRETCCAPGCHAEALPAFRIPMCVDCARNLAHQYYAERSAILSPDPDQTLEATARAAAGDFDVHGSVYFIRLGTRIKIGFTTNTAERLRGLPHEEVIGVIPGTMQDERACHALFARTRVTGEWFEDTPNLRNFVHEQVAERERARRNRPARPPQEAT